MANVAIDLRHEPRHAPGVGADELERRLAHLLAIGFDAEGADKVFEAISLPSPEDVDQRLADLTALGFADPVKMVTTLPAILGLAIDNIRGKLADLTALGFADPVKMVTSSPAILGYAKARVLLVGGIVAGLDDRADGQFARLISKPRVVIDAIAAARPRTWSEVLRIAREETAKRRSA